MKDFSNENTRAPAGNSSNCNNQGTVFKTVNPLEIITQNISNQPILFIVD